VRTVDAIARRASLFVTGARRGGTSLGVDTPHQRAARSGVLESRAGR
jgi:hypothetical protein